MCEDCPYKGSNIFFCKGCNDFEEHVKEYLGGMINMEIAENVFEEMIYGKEWLENKYKNPKYFFKEWLENKYKNPKYFFDDKTKKDGWRTDEPPRNVDIELLCVLFDEDEYRTLEKGYCHDYNRIILTGCWNGHEFAANYGHSSGDPWYCVVAWKEIDYGEKFYSHCLGEARPRR